MPDERTLHEYRVRFRVDTDHAERRVHATADRRAQTITLELPHGARNTVDVVTARAVCMLLHEAIYTSLEPVGPFLRLERNTANGWTLGDTGR